MNTFNRLLDIPSTDPDDARKGKLLNIILVGLAILLLLVLIFSVFAIPYTPTTDIVIIFGGTLFLLAGMVVVYFVNKLWSGKAAAASFLVLLTVVITFSDTAENISTGRALFAFTIPIIMASVLLTPSSSFVFGTLSGLIITIIALSINSVPNIPAIIGYLVVALVSWLSSRSLEQALKELRQINAELDRRVEDRTRELSAALARELIEAGKNQAILEGIADGVVVFDPDGKSIVANPALGRLLQIPSSELMNVTMRDILAGNRITQQDRETILSLIEDPLQESPSVRFRWDKSTLLVNASLVKSGGGDLIGTVAVFRDFTREAEVEQLKNTFVAMISHELRTPLNAILGYAEMMREKVFGSISQRQAGVMERIESSSQRLLGIVSDLLDQAQIDAGRMKIHIAEFQFTDLIHALHAYMDKTVADKGLFLDVNVDASLPESARGDAQRIGQVLLNLVGNAVKFTQIGGVNVRLYRVDELRWGFSVADTGPGIPPEAQQYIFESFRQVESVTTREHGGIGLGLAIVKKLVELMSGEITLSSKVGEGSTFLVVFPFQLDEESL